MEKVKSDVTIIGGGAAGLMCALSAGKRKRSVVVLEHMEEIAGKLRVSGGGRCNFTNLTVSSDNYVSHNPHFCKSALTRFTPYDVIDMLERAGIRYFEKEAGQLFCTAGSSKIVRLLQKGCSEAGVRVYTNCRVNAVKKEDCFIVATSHGTVESQALVVATGGLSYPRLGATDSGLRIARQFGLKVTPLKPALVPLTFGQKDLDTFGDLSGISLDATVSCRNALFGGKLLFTHRGLSGPAILQTSLYWEKDDAVTINLLPGIDTYALLVSRRGSRMRIENLLSAVLPARLAKKWCRLSIESKPLIQYTERDLREIAHKLQNWPIIPEGTEGYGQAEVTLGGVDTNELSSKTMEARKVPGLYFVGEVVDVTGQLGGYNLQWAWSSGHTAGQYV